MHTTTELAKISCMKCSGSLWCEGCYNLFVCSTISVVCLFKVVVRLWEDVPSVCFLGCAI